ncbi:MAG: hypothetical protein HYY24_06095 [Verrucomicrobia bacterium]|nr:hypothetical protein [Verrucomicrobiota bacterium]
MVARVRIAEVTVVAQKGDPAQPVQEREDLLVGHSETPHFAPDLPDSHAEPLKQIAFVVREVLVQQIHAVTSSRA